MLNQPDAAPPFVTTRYSGHDGVPLVADVAAAREPQAPTIVLLHGGGQTRHSWGTAAQSLAARGYGVVNLDARGHGDSGWSADGRYGLDRLALDLQQVLQTLRPPVALVGASMGGGTALAYVGRGLAPAAAALVLVDVVPAIERAGADRIRAFMQANPEGFASIEEAADAVARYYPQRPRPKDISGLRKNLRPRPDGRLRWHWDPHVLDGPHTLEPPTAQSILTEASRRVRIPTLLVRGLQSDIVGDAGVAALQRDLPQLEVLNIAGAAHMVAGDRNDVFNDGVVAFLERHLPAG
ncbi:MAG: alpha/beta fold hydrolase [Sinobacteraceae bacterium]|nr:alpha/beta fold hydrolase [Nevskiaceae bacterium]MCP5359494.1 alpha/beta fold hydrolase [Nevskiaceae bacterium]MCP5466837.1 alpha/beta fold hydrolase [Nevskiaceae bacterium]MCP5470926.1 alpha/beta fold hydrolase [Nevskiaceae bacterium]